jgi:hypothetical protein
VIGGRDGEKEDKFDIRDKNERKASGKGIDESSASVIRISCPILPLHRHSSPCFEQIGKLNRANERIRKDIHGLHGGFLFFASSALR